MENFTQTNLQMFQNFFDLLSIEDKKIFIENNKTILKHFLNLENENKSPQSNLVSFNN